jgi:hypothetical protein
MPRELSALSPMQTRRSHSDPRPRRQPLPPKLMHPRAEVLLREMAFVLRATRAVRESMWDRA